MIVVSVIGIVFVGGFLSYAIYRLALKHRNIFLLIGLAILCLGCFVYATGGSSGQEAHIDYRCSCMTNAVAPASADVMLGRPSNKVGLSILHGLAALDKALSSFFPSRGGYGGEDDSVIAMSSIGFYWDVLYWLFHLLVIIYLVSALVAVFGEEFVNRLLIWMKWVRHRMLQKNGAPLKLCVFWDICEESLNLSEGVGKIDLAGYSPVFVFPQDRRSWMRLSDEDGYVSRLMDRGCRWVIGDVSNAGCLKTAQYHFFLGSDERRNVERAEMLLSEIAQGQGCLGPVYVYVRVCSDIDDSAMYDWADAQNRAKTNSGIDVSVEIVSESAIVSRKFLIDHPMLDSPGVAVDVARTAVSGSFNVLLVGFGKQGHRLMCDMVCDAQYLDANGACVPIAVDVVDRDATSYGWFAGNCQEACSRYGIAFHCIDGESSDFWKWLESRPVYNRIVVCTTDDVFNLKLSNSIANFYGIHFDRFRQGDGKTALSNIIFARVRSHALASSIMATCKSKAMAYRIFGDVADTYNTRSLLNDKWNSGAIFLNGVWSAMYDRPESLEDGCPITWYKANKERGMGYWRRATVFNRESSRAALVNMRNLLRLIGYDVSFLPAPPEGRAVSCNQIEEVMGELRKEKCVRALPEMEHLRWMAFHFVRGWCRWKPTPEELREISGRTDRKNAIEANSMKSKAPVHADLVDFDQLAKVDELFNEVNRREGRKLTTSTEKDKNIIFSVEALYDSGFCVSRKLSKSICLAIAAFAPVFSSSLLAADSPVSIRVVEVVERGERPVKRIPGRVVSLADVDVVSQVRGRIEEVAFKNGAFVHAGDLMYRIAPEMYQAKVSEAEARVEASRVKASGAQRNYERRKALGSRGVSQEGVENARGERDSATAMVKAAESALALARLDLANCRIVAPISGVAGTSLKAAGDYVRDGITLTSVVQIAPVRVRFSLSSGEFLRMFDGRAGVACSNAVVRLTLADGTLFSENGSVEYVENVVDEKTDSIRMYARFENVSEVLRPGGSVSVSLSDRRPRNGLVIPSGAVCLDADGAYVWVVDDGGVVRRRNIVCGRLDGGWRFVFSGLAKGDRVVADGDSYVEEGMTVDVASGVSQK